MLVNGALKSNERSLEYFGLSSRDLPRVGLYDVDLDKKWLMPKGQITKDAVRAFCQSFLDGELQVRRRCTCCLRSFTQVTEVVTNCHKIMYAHTCKQTISLSYKLGNRLLVWCISEGGVILLFSEKGSSISPCMTVTLLCLQHCLR